ncbi:PPOX class F420-dependent oxidoreductase [Streptomyces fuscigenes]|uniref:PPOX class F420-dependent oxidoreductase n=1 Tax=Streptomyces fuscigenes TaxID=1528880 RepID=UPI001F1F6A24|nr:PPOX class F420-dependent oxidoreductase [Streptomyces fuscigenes]MCF3965512.1 PPOX class F420-dependent oxidoreductase [Streptomyces fuscigenes]
MAAELSENLRRLVDGARTFAKVATLLPDGTPHVAVVWLGRDGDDLVFATGAGSRKASNLRRDPRITVLLNPAAAPYTYAEVRGTATLSEDAGPALLDRLSIAYEGKPYGEFSSGASTSGTVAVRITPEKIVDTL